MKAIILKPPGKFEPLTKDEPAAPGPAEVLLKIKYVSICGTDLHAYKGNQPFFTYPRILGHEVAAEVVKVGSGVTNIKPGDTCTIEPYRNPLIDQAVLKGKTNCGSKLTVLGVHEDGAMQEYITYLASNIHLTNGLPAEQVSLVEPFSIGAYAVEITLQRFLNKGDMHLDIEDWSEKTTGVPANIVQEIKAGGNEFKSIQVLPQYQTVLNLNN